MTVLEFPSPAEQDAPPGYVTSLDLVRRAGITYRQFDYWVRTGRLRAAPRTRNVSGYPRYFPVEEVAVACLMGRLVAGGLGLPQSHQAARELLEHGATTLAGIPVHLPQEL